LGPPVTVDDVRNMQVPRGRANLVASYVDLLERGRWDPDDPIYSEVKALVGRALAETMAPVPRPKHQSEEYPATNAEIFQRSVVQAEG
jgi:hypothetical protein